MQKYVLLNVPARQSRNYYDYFKANIPNEYLVFVDALFGGLDVAARIRFSSESENNFISDTILELIESKGQTKEGAVLNISPFLDQTKVGIEENFILVIILTDIDMRDPLHQKTLISFLERSHIINRLRFAATISNSLPVDGVALPLIVEKYTNNFSKGEVSILEFRVDDLDDPRNIVMRSLQSFTCVLSSRTFFAVNYAKEDEHISSKVKEISMVIKKWLSLLLNWRRIFGF